MPAIVVLGRLNTPENIVIPLHPNAPTHNYDYVHKEWHPEQYFQVLQGGESIILSNHQTNGRPTELCKIIVDKDMCESFIHRLIAANTKVEKQHHISSFQQFPGR